jgi:hypothetical protein
MIEDMVVSRFLTSIDQVGEQIGADVADAKATGDYQLLHERMVANLESLEFCLDKMAGKLLLATKDYRNE